MDLGPSVKVFSTKKEANAHTLLHYIYIYSTFIDYGCVQADIRSVANPRKFSLRNPIFHRFVKDFSLESFLLYGRYILMVFCMYIYIRISNQQMSEKIQIAVYI